MNNGQASVPHPDIGDWWALYDYGLEAIKAWPLDFKPSYPEEMRRQVDGLSRLLWSSDHWKVTKLICNVSSQMLSIRLYATFYCSVSRSSLPSDVQPRLSSAQSFWRSSRPTGLKQQAHWLPYFELRLWSTCFWCFDDSRSHLVAGSNSCSTATSVPEHWRSMQSFLNAGYQ